MMRGGFRPVRAILGGVLLLATLLGAWPTPAAAAASGRWCPQQAAPYCAENAFLDYWQAVDAATGGYALDIIGFPVSPPLQMPSGLIVQFYERAIFEWHPEKPLAYQVLLTRLGALAIDLDTKLGLKAQAAKAPEPCPNTNECYLAQDTNHSLRGTFLLYWGDNGGLPVFGFPLSEQFQLTYVDGKVYNVQYFERNRFEAHPENTNPRYQVLLGRLGAETLAANSAEIKAWKVVATPNYGGAQAAGPPAPPVPSPQPSPPPATTPASADQQLVNAAFNLIRGVPSMQHIPDNLIARNVQWVFDASLPAGAYGSYRASTNTIRYHPMFRTMDPHDLAALTGHEGQHAYDIGNFGRPRTTDACYVLEYRGFLAETALWYAWYGGGGKANAVNNFERDANAIMKDIKYNDGKNVQAFILDAYSEECGAQLEMNAADQPASASIPATLEGLPALVGELFPDAAAQLARIAAGPSLTATEAAETTPDWVKR